MRIAELCVGYVPADLAALFRRAKYLAMQKESNKENKLLQDAIALDYLEVAMNDVGASALRDASLSAPPKTTWDDIAGDPGSSKVRRNTVSNNPSSYMRELLNLFFSHCYVILYIDFITASY